MIHEIDGSKYRDCKPSAMLIRSIENHKQWYALQRTLLFSTNLTESHYRGDKDGLSFFRKKLTTILDPSYGYVYTNQIAS